MESSRPLHSIPSGVVLNPRKAHFDSMRNMGWFMNNKKKRNTKHRQWKIKRRSGLS